MPSSFFAWLSGATLAVRAVVLVLGLALLVVGGCVARHARELESRGGGPTTHLTPLLLWPLVALPTLLSLENR